MLYNEKRRIYVYSLDCFEDSNGKFSRIKIGETTKDLEGEKGVLQRINEQKGTGVPGKSKLLAWWPSVNIEDTDLHKEIENVFQDVKKHNEWFNLSLEQVKIVYDKLLSKTQLQNRQQETENYYKEIIKRQQNAYHNLIDELIKTLLSYKENNLDIDIDNVFQNVTSTLQKPLNYNKIDFDSDINININFQNSFNQYNDLSVEKINIKEISEFMKKEYVDIFSYVDWIENTFNTLINNKREDVLTKIMSKLSKCFTFKENFQRKDGRIFEEKYVKKIILVDERLLKINSNLSTGAKQEIINKIKEIIKQEM